MAQEYTIEGVNNTESTDQHGNTIFFAQLSGVDAGVEMHKKKEPQKGWTVYGELDERNKNGKKYYRFFPKQREEFGGKKEKKPYGKSPKEQEAIQKQTALKAAVEYANVSLDAGTHQTPEQVLDTANTFFNWLKGEVVETSNSVDSDKPADLSDIPF